jgi:hypothetical protein
VKVGDSEGLIPLFHFFMNHCDDSIVNCMCLRTVRYRCRIDKKLERGLKPIFSDEKKRLLFKCSWHSFLSTLSPHNIQGSDKPVSLEGPHNSSTVPVEGELYDRNALEIHTIVLNIST